MNLIKVTTREHILRMRKSVSLFTRNQAKNNKLGKTLKVTEEPAKSQLKVVPTGRKVKSAALHYGSDRLFIAN